MGTCSSGEGVVGGAGQGLLHIRVHQRLGPHHHLSCARAGCSSLSTFQHEMMHQTLCWILKASSLGMR